MGWKRTWFSSVTVLSVYHLGCAWTKPRCSFCVAASQVFSLHQGFKKDYLEEITTFKLKFKDLKLGLKLRSLVVKFTTFWAEEAKVRGGGWEQVLVRSFPVLMKAFLGQYPESLYKNTIDNRNCSGRATDHGWSFFFWCPVKSLRFNLGLIGWDGEAWAQSEVLWAAELFTLWAPQ